jgi:hypothetical protein
MQLSQIPKDLISYLATFVSYFELDSLMVLCILSTKELKTIKAREYKKRIKMQIVHKCPVVMNTFSSLLYTGPCEEWRMEEIRHREDGPAINNTTVGLQIWCYKGVAHRDNGPAYVETFGSQLVQYFKHGVFHRKDGPANTGIYSIGVQNLWRRDWFENGKFIKSIFIRGPLNLIISNTSFTYKYKSRASCKKRRKKYRKLRNNYHSKF